jgi:hypothetical protein
MLYSTKVRSTFRWSCGVLLCAVVLAGCAQYPTVRYTEVTPESDERALRGQLQFQLYGSWVTLTKPSADKPQDAVAATGLRQFNQPVTSLAGLVGAQVLVTPASSAHQYAVAPVSSAFTSTSLDATYIASTRLLKSVGFEFENRSVKTIEAVGGAVAALLPLFAPGQSAAALTLPVVLDVSDPSTWQAWRAIPGATGQGWAYRVVPTDRPALLGATPRQAFFDDSSGRATRLFPVSGCVRATLQVRNDPASGEYQSFPVTLAHPDFLYTYFLPAKGSITMHGVCGADLTVDATSNSTASAFAALEAVFKQVQAIKAAQDAGKK